VENSEFIALGHLAARVAVRNNLHKIHRKNKARCTRVGGHDLVLLNDHFLCWASHKMSAKLPPRWRDPFPLAHFLTPVSVILVHPQNWGFCTSAHFAN